MRAESSSTAALVLVLATGLATACGTSEIPPFTDGPAPADAGAKEPVTPAADTSDAAPIDGSTPPCTPGTEGCFVRADVLAVSVATASGAAPRKGDPLRVVLTVKNLGHLAGVVTLVPKVKSGRFADFEGVPLGQIAVPLAADEQRDFAFTAGPFLDDDARGKHYALGRGDYTITSVAVTATGEAATEDATFTGGAFTIAKSEAVFDAVVYDQAYFDKLKYTKGPEAWMTESFTRAGEVFTPDAPASSNGAYAPFPAGFDAMLKIRQLYRSFPGFSASDAKGGFCEQADAYAKTALGLTRDWDVGDAPTDLDHHGFDILVGLTPAMIGGATCGWLGTQVSGLFDFDLSIGRSSMVMVHEQGHVFGAPHCDPLQGYVMCSGEKHAHYLASGTFVWHKASLDAMKSGYD